MNRIFVLLSLSFFSTATSLASTSLHLTSCDAGQKAFERTLYPLLKTRCTECHGDAGTAVHHSASSVEEAYAHSKELADFAHLENSTFVQMVDLSHWVARDPKLPSNLMVHDEIMTALKAWWDEGENSCSSEFGFTSAEVTVPADLPMWVTGKFVEMNWKLNAGVAGESCDFKLEIQRFTNFIPPSQPGAPSIPGAFRVRNPQIRCTRAFKVEQLRILVNGSTKAYENLFDSVSVAVPPSLNFVNLSSEILILIERDGTNHLSLAFKGFTRL